MKQTDQNKINKLNADDWTQVLAAFDHLSDLTATEQSTYLADIQLSDQAKDMVTKMLASQDEPHILDHTIDPFVEILLGAEAVSERFNPSDIIGRSFGPWQVLDELAKGGMGQVFVAQRADGEFEKQVAIKVIKSGSFSALTEQRFKAEMQTLAQFEHPHIARLIDGGTSDDGIAYIVMELVVGTSICDYASSHALSLSARIHLVLQAIEAVEYAHQNLIIHGDIKPANLLVNDVGQVKLVDFGIARPFQEASGVAYLPQFTPSYSSPEQAQGKSLSTASDVFGLCAVLYELCSGLSPRARESVTTYIEYKQQLNTPIKNVFHRYQTRLSEADTDVLAGHDSHQFTQALSQELGAIIDKGLQVEVSNRYKNTTELRNDLLLYTQGSVVPTYANNLMYRWRKAWHRNKASISISLMAVLGIVTFAVIAMNQAKVAEREAEKAQWTSEFLLGIFDQADPVKNQQNPITVNELTRFASEQLLKDEADFTPPVLINALSLIGSIQYKLGQAESAAKIHTKLVELLQQEQNKSQELAQAHFDLAMDYQQLGVFESALQHFKLAGEVTPLEQEVTHLGVTALQSEVMIYTRQNKLKEATAIINQLLALEEDILKTEEALLTMVNLYIAKARVDEHNQAFPQALQAIDKTKFYFKQIPYDPIFFAEILGTESSIHAHMQNYDLAAQVDQKSVAIFKQHYGTQHPETLIALANQATHLGQSGDYEAAIVAYLEIVGMIEGMQVPDFFAPIMNQNLAQQYRKNEQCHEAIKYFQLAESQFSGLETRRVLAEINTFSGQARCHLQLDDWEQSEAFFQQALALAKEHYGPEHTTYVGIQQMYWKLLLAQNKLTEMAAMIPGVQRILMEKYGSDSIQVAHVYLKWAQLHERQNNLIEAQKMSLHALTIYSDQQSTDQYAALIEEAKRLQQLK